jgi:hypothetical protein
MSVNRIPADRIAAGLRKGNAKRQKRRERLPAPEKRRMSANRIQRIERLHRGGSQNPE